VAGQSTRASAGAKGKAPAKGSKEIDLGEEMFAHGGTKASRVSEVMEQLDSRAAPSAVAPPANPAEAAQQIASSGIIAVDDSNFQPEVMSYTDTPVLLAFYSTDVPSSNSTAPVLLSIAQQADPKIKVGVVDVNLAKGVKQRYLVDQLPTCVLVVKGQEFARFGPEVTAAAVNQQVKLSTVKNLPHEDRAR
jgi:thioredoxin-like negative regulator of GroEL